jgi:hypothetical protein
MWTNLGSKVLTCLKDGGGKNKNARGKLLGFYDKCVLHENFKTVRINDFAVAQKKSKRQKKSRKQEDL